MEDSGSALIEGTVFETGDGSRPSGADGLERGGTLARYLLVERLGVGGMGVVWAAYDPELDRKIAIKLLRPRRDRGLCELARTRLIREAQVMARINHPNVIAVHDVGEHDGQVFLAMEFVQGKTLGRWVRSTRRSWTEVVAVFVQAGRGLAEAHRAGLVHRDFKPANVLIDGKGRARVLDFGLARSVEGPRTDREDEAGDPDSWSASRIQRLQQDSIVTPLTRTGSMLGTPAYMAPEQFEGRSFDSRADQFAFCVALWEALHHRRPFSGATIGELSRNVCSGAIEAATSDSRVPGFVDRALRRGLAVDPAERWPSMDALLTELSRDPARGRRRWLTAGAVVASFTAALIVSPMLEREPVEASVEVERVVCPEVAELMPESWTPARRHELSLAVLGSGALTPERWADVDANLDAYASAHAAARVRVCEGKQAGVIADADLRERCLDDRARALAMTVELLGGADRELIAGAHGMVAALPSIAACDRPGQLVASERRYDGLRSRLLGATGRAEAGAVEQARVELRELEREAEAIGQRDLAIEILLAQAEVDQRVGEHGRARGRLERAVAEAIRGNHDRLAGRAATRLIDVVGRDLGEREAGLRWAARADAWQARVDAPALARAERLAAEADLYLALGELDTATRQHLMALELVGLSEALEHPTADIAINRLAARALHGLARVAIAQDDPALARERWEQVAALRRAAYGAHPPD